MNKSHSLTSFQRQCSSCQAPPQQSQARPAAGSDMRRDYVWAYDHNNPNIIRANTSKILWARNYFTKFNFYKLYRRLIKSLVKRWNVLKRVTFSRHNCCWNIRPHCGYRTTKNRLISVTERNPTTKAWRITRQRNRANYKHCITGILIWFETQLSQSWLPPHL